ncbi:MAG: mannose-1-phosphate guanylyltransferase [Candidatus Marinimicrobia bacterium]|jgi:mannose-1-phosphate guanylyltransferase|nr:mannose-1-phosphate guanylyltransferase [Candidatus Neomarinimicrobiota bacterium]MDP6789517.1 mannose-1-phosphate guanylyltransferase [Candidatus Neomarinimicrobiota bacterium]MDP7072748.1 mannose-1-phosphate guanylyltransferase [Candidatus Neomarinimicrobiota bacterium]
MFAVIMAGGKGKRFWPYSRNDRPKQLLKIIGEETMLQMTVDRLKKLKSVEDIFIVTGKDLAPLIQKEIKGISKNNIIVEPSGKNTAPCIGLAALKIGRIDENAVMGIFPADHLIIGHKLFQKALTSGSKIATKMDSLVTIGIIPSYPSTGYGYIQHSSRRLRGFDNAYNVKTFAEKPHLSLANRFISSGDFLWNGGMFIWKISTILDQFGIHMPELSDHLFQIQELQNSRKSISGVWDRIVPESIDYGLMEKADNVHVVKAEFTWSDVGSWQSVFDLSSKNKQGNVIRGDGVSIGGTNNFIDSNDRFTAVIGADDLAVIHTDDATLVVPMEKVEEVKNLVEYLQSNKREELL